MYWKRFVSDKTPNSLVLNLYSRPINEFGDETAWVYSDIFR